MEEKFRKITVTDEHGNIKNIQEYEHNSYGDPTYFKKMVGDKVLTKYSILITMMKSIEKL